jgi:hypothetical protein
MFKINYSPDSSTIPHLPSLSEKKLLVKNNSYDKIALKKLIEILLKAGNSTFDL